MSTNPFSYPYYNGTILPIIVFTLKDGNNALQFTNPSKNYTVKNQGSNDNLIGCYPNEEDGNNNNTCPCYPKIPNPDSTILGCLVIGDVNGTTNGQCTTNASVNYYLYLLQNGDYSLPIVNPQNPSLCSLDSTISINTYYVNVNAQNQCNGYGVVVTSKSVGGQGTYDFGSCSMTIFSGIFNNNASTTINQIPGQCMTNPVTTDTLYNFHQFSFISTYTGVQSNHWNTPIQGGWSVSVDNDPNYPYGNFISGGNETTGNIQSRYYYTGLTTIFNNGLSDLGQFTSYLSTLPTSYIGATTVLFSSSPSYPFFVISTVLYIFLYLFYGEMYSAGPFQSQSQSGNTLFSSKDVLLSSDLTSYRSTIQTLYDSITGPFVAKSSPNTLLLSSSTFISFCMYPQIYFNDDSTVSLQVYVPISLLQTSINGIPFYQLDLSGQENVLITWLQHFFNESDGDYFTTSPSISKKYITPSVFQLQPYGSNSGRVYATVLDLIHDLSLSNQTVQIDMNSGTNTSTYTNTTMYNNAYTITNTPSNSTNSSTSQPYFMYGIFYMKITKWSVKLAAYCSKQFGIATDSNSVALSSSISTTLLPVLTLPTIYEQIRQDTNGWILNDYYNYLISTYDTRIIYSDLLKNNCNSYFHSDGTLYTGISPYFMTTTGGIYNQSQLDCMCYNSLLSSVQTNTDASGVNVDLSGKYAAMCYDQHCYNSALPNPTPVLTAFGLTPTICANAQNCSTVNQFMIGTGNDRAQNPSVINNTLYTSNCGSLYTFNQSTRNNTIMWIGISCALLATLFTYVISALGHYRPFVIVLLCCVVLAVFSLLTYYGSIYLKGNWTCSSFGTIQSTTTSSTTIKNPNQNQVSQPICVSVKNPSLVLPDDCCEGQIATSCECVVDSDCACSGGASHCQSGQCEYNSNVGKTRPQLTVTTNQPRVFVVAFMFILAISVPLLFELIKRLVQWKINGIVYGILVLIIMAIPFGLSVYYGLQKVSKTVYTDSCAV
jgi:hypothetical protein